MLYYVFRFVETKNTWSNKVTNFEDSIFILLVTFSNSSSLSSLHLSLSHVLSINQTGDGPPLSHLGQTMIDEPLIKQDFLLFPKGPSPCTASLMTVPICSLIDGFPPLLLWVGYGRYKKKNYLATKWKVEKFAEVTTGVFYRGNVWGRYLTFIKEWHSHSDSLELQQPVMLPENVLS